MIEERVSRRGDAVALPAILGRTHRLTFEEGTKLLVGGEIDMPPTEAGRIVFAIFRDPNGNRIGLVRA